MSNILELSKTTPVSYFEYKRVTNENIELSSIVVLRTNEVSKIKEILEHQSTIRHPCGCLQLDNNMLKKDACGTHQLPTLNTFAPDAQTSFSLYMEETNASNLRLYTILGIILG